MSDELAEIQDSLKDAAALKIDLRGQGVGKFLYVRSSNRAVEISLADEGVFVEYWNNADELSDEAPVKSEVVPSTTEALTNVLAWLH